MAEETQSGPNLEMDRKTGSSAIFVPLLVDPRELPMLKKAHIVK